MNRTHKSSSPGDSHGQLSIQPKAKGNWSIAPDGAMHTAFPSISSNDDLQSASCIFVSVILVFLLHSCLFQKKRECVEGERALERSFA